MIDGSIPIVDLEDFFSEGTKKSFIKEVGLALENIGFFAVKNHTVTDDLLSNVYNSSTKFFNLSDDVKMKYEKPEILRQRGIRVIQSHFWL